MPPSPFIQTDKEIDLLIQEFHVYAKDWASRFHQIDSSKIEKTIPPQVFKNLFTLIDNNPGEEDTLPFQIQQFVSLHLHQGITLKYLSDFLGYSEKYCSELFRQKMGHTFSSYLKQMRLRKAIFF